jgi:hypothetical protein
MTSVHGIERIAAMPTEVVFYPKRTLSEFVSQPLNPIDIAATSQSNIGYSVRLANDATTVRARSIKSFPTGGSSLFFKVTIATGVDSIGR